MTSAAGSSVNPTLSRGLADRAIDALEHQADRYVDARLLALILQAAASELHLRQVALPTSSGTFLCHLDDGASTLRARTWIDNDSMGPRWTPLVAGLRSAIGAGGGEPALALALSKGMAASREEDPELHAAVRRLLERHAWLREPYVRRPEPVGEKWDRARRALAPR